MTEVSHMQASAFEHEPTDYSHGSEIDPSVADDQIFEQNKEMFVRFLEENDHLIRTAVRLRIFHSSPLEFEDTYQEAVIHIWRKIHLYKSDVSTSAWIHAVVGNLIKDKIRRYKVRPVEESLDAVSQTYETRYHPTTTIDEQLQQEYTPELIEFMRRHEHIEHATDLLLAVNNGFSVDECGKMFDIARGTASSRMTNTRKRLRRYGKQLLGLSATDYVPESLRS